MYPDSCSNSSISIDVSGNETGTLTLSTVADQSDYACLLSTVRYDNTADEPNSSFPRSVIFTVKDGVLPARSATATVRLSRVCDEPRLFLDGRSRMFSTSYNEETDNPVAVVNASNWAIEDDDSNELSNGTITIETNFDAMNDKLNVTGSNPNITTSYNNSTGILTFTGNATLSEYKALIASVQFYNLYKCLEPKTRKVIFRFWDTCNRENLPSTTWVSILPLNDPPVLSLNGITTVTYVFTRNLDRPELDIAAMAELTDCDNPTLDFVNITVAEAGDSQDGNSFTGKERLTFDTDGTSVQVSSATVYDFSLSYRLTGGMDVDEFQRVLQSASYINEADIPRDNDRIITITVSDGVLSDSATVRLIMDQQPASPVLNWNDSYIAEYVEDGASVAFLNITEFEVVAGDTDFFHSAVLTVTNPKMNLDSLTFPDTSVLVDITLLGQNTYSLTFTADKIGDILLSDVQDWLKMVVFSSGDQAPDYVRNISVVVKDSPLKRQSPTLYVSLRIKAVNDRPVISGTPLLSNVTLENYLPQSTNNPGYRVDDIINGSAVSDVDLTDPVFIAIFNASLTDGLLGKGEYRKNGDWVEFPPLSDCNPLLLVSTDRIRFKPIENFNKASGTASVKYRVWDNTSNPYCINGTLRLTAESPVSNETAMSSVAVVYSNHAPTINSSLTANFKDIDEDVLGAKNDGEVVSSVISEVASDADDEHLGVAIIWVGNENGTWQYRAVNGTWANIPVAVNSTNAFLVDPHSRIRFDPDLHVFGRRSIRFKAWDASEFMEGDFADTTASNVFSGSFSTANTTAFIDVLSINDAPVINTSGVGRRIYTENGKDLSVFDGKLSISDVDTTNLTSVTVTLTRNNLTDGDCEGTPSETVSGSGSADGSGSMPATNNNACPGATTDVPKSDCLRFTGNTSGFTTTFVYDDDVLTVKVVSSPPKTLKQFENLLNTLEFSNTAMETTNVNRFITVTASDGEDTSDKATVTIEITLVNDNAPSLALPSLTLDFTEDSTSRSLFSSEPDISDDDCHNIFYVERAWARLTGYDDANKENLTANAVYNESKVTQSWNPNTGVLTISGNASVSTYETILGSLVYYNLVSEPNGNDQLVTIWLSDGKFTSNNETVTIRIELINDQIPVLLLDSSNGSVNFSAVFFESNTVATPVSVTGRVSLTDADSFYTRLYCEIIILENVLDGDKESIYLEGGVAGSVNATTTQHSITLSGGDSLEELAQTFARLRYVNSAEEPDSTTRTIKFEVVDELTDGTRSVVTAYSFVTISVLNDPPKLYLGVRSVTYREGDPPIALAPNSTVSDVDNTSLSSAQVYFRNTSGTSFEVGEDILSFNMNNTNVTGTYDSQSGVLSLTGPASVNDFLLVLRTVSYEYATEKGDPVLGNHEILFVVNDGLVNSRVERVVIDFTSVNNRPVLQLGGRFEEMNVIVTFTEEEGSINVVPQDVSLFDPDNTSLSYITINLTNPRDQMEYLSATASGNVSVTGIPGSLVRLDGPAMVDDFINVLKTVMYNNKADEPTPGSRLVEFTVSDGDRLSEVVTATVNIVFVNDRPELDLNGNANGTGVSVTFTENGQPVSLATPTVSVKDDDNDTMTKLRVVLVGLMDGAHEVVSYGTTTLTVTTKSPANGTYIYTFNPAASLTEIEAFIANLTYTNNADEPTLGVRRAQISVYDGDVWSVAANATVTIRPVNDQTPQFNQTVYETNVTEESPKASVVKVVATDGDSYNMEVTITYGISNNSNCANGFLINAVTGEITTSVNPPDREKVSYCNLNVTASDSVRTGEAKVIIRIVDINDNNPKIVDYPMSVFVNETTRNGTEIFNVSATDSDTGENARIAYSLYPHDLPFAIGSENGRVSVSGYLNFESRVNYKVTVLANDFGSPTRSSNVTVMVRILNANEHLPVFNPATYSKILCENSDINRTVVIVTATDVDSGSLGALTYSLDDPVFAVHSRTGRVYNKVPLDFEKSPRYDLKIVAEDGGDLTDTATVTVYVHNENEYSPEFVPGSYIAYVSENVSVGVVIRQCVATDNDSCIYDQCDNGTSVDCDGQCNGTESGSVDGSGSASGSGDGCGTAKNNSLVYSIVKSSPLGPFRIDSSGSITVNSKLDRETVDKYNVTVQVTDGQYITKKMFCINVTDINDNAPIFDNGNYSAKVTENSQLGTTVITATATDLDIDRNGHVTYRLDGPLSWHFNISATGVVTVAAAIDRESVESYNLEIVAEDWGRPRRWSRVPLTITVLDLNDNSPVFSQAAYVVEINEDYGSETDSSYTSGADSSAEMVRDIVIVNASDPDLGEGGVVEYRIRSGDSAFLIDMVSGAITSERHFDREETVAYHLVVEARDGGPHVRTSIVNVTVTLLDLNDNSPEFRIANTTRSVYENVTIGTSVFSQIEIYDPDEGRNGQVLFTKGKDFPDDFDLNSTDGAISVARSLDRETTESYEFDVTAIDQASDVSKRLNNTIRLKIVVLDINDETPVITPNSSAVSLKETVSVGTVVGSFNITDTDLGINGEFDVTIFPSDSPFNVTLLHGGVAVVRVSARLDYEKTPFHRIHVRAVDRGTPSLSSSAVIDVTLINENDEAPAVVNENTDGIYYLEGHSKAELEPDMNITDPDGFPFTKLYNSTVKLIDRETFELGPEPFDCPVGISDKSTKIDGCGFEGASVITDPADLTLQEGARLEGYTLILDGDDDFADYEKDIGDLVDGITIGLWVKLDRLPANGSESVIFSKRHPVERHHYYTLSVLPDGEFRVRTTSSSGGQTTDFNGVGQKCVGKYCMLSVLIHLYNTTHWTVIVIVDGEACGQRFIDPVVDEDGHSYVGATTDDNGFLTNFFSGRIHFLFAHLSAAAREEYFKCIAGCGEALHTSVDDLPVGVTAAYSYSTGTLSISGMATLTEYVTLLNSLIYVSDVDEPRSGTRTVEVRVSDGAFISQNPGIIIITMSLTNDNPPVLNLNGPLGANFSTVFVEDDSDGGMVNITNSSGLTVTDGDRGSFPYDVTVSILNAVDGSNEILAVGNDQTYTYDSNTNILTFSATVDVSSLQNTLRTVTYDNTAEEPDPKPRLVRFHIRDGQRQESTNVYSTVSILFVNDPPVLQLYSMIDYNEGDGPRTVNSNLSVSDNDNTTLTRARSWIVSGVDLSEERLNANTTGTKIRKSYNVSTGTLLLWGEEHLSVYENVLRGLTYEHLDQGDPKPGPRMVKTRVFDGQLYSNEVEALITFSAVNDAPIVDLNGPSIPGFDYSSARFTEGSPPVVIVSKDAEVIDVDNTTLEYLEAMLVSLPDQTNETLSVSIPSSSRLRQVYNNATGRLTVKPSNGNATVEEYKSVLRTLRYQNEADELTGEIRNVTVIASDGLLTSMVATIFISLSSSDDKPVITIPANTSTTYYDSSGPVNILPASSVSISDADVNSRIRSFHFVLRGVENVTLEYLIFPDGDMYDKEEKRQNNWIDYNVTHKSGGVSLSDAEDFLEQVSYNSDIDEPDTAIHRQVEVSVHDGALESDTVMVPIDIRLINDHSPIFSQPDGYESSISENVSPRDIVTVVASDDDKGVDGQLMYSLSSCECVRDKSMNAVRHMCRGSPFSVDNVTGVVKSTTSLDRENTSICYLVVEATDLGSPANTTAVTLTVNVTDVNDVAPAFVTGTNFAVDVAENTQNGSLAFTLTATDGDDSATDNGKVFYRVVGGTGSGLFTITDENVGNVSLNGRLDVDGSGAITFYTVTVEARDRGLPSLATNSTFNVTITDIDDNCPYFDPTLYTADVSENSANGITILNFTVIDTDATADNRKFTISIPEGNIAGVFAADGVSLEVNDTLDREDISWYRLRVSVRSTDIRCDHVAWVNITVLDVNDVPPCFEESSYYFTVDETVAVGYSVGRLNATDDDDGSNGEFMFSLRGASSSNFSIDQYTGVITTSESLDRETYDCFTFSAIATDKGYPSLSCNASITVCLNDTNDETPFFSRNIYNFNVSENKQNVSLGFVSATDNDVTDKFNVVTYSLSGPDSVKFAVHSTSGKVYVTRELDYETQCLYNFTVIATDAGGLTGSARIIVTVQDENEYAPSFVDKNDTIYLKESADPGILVFQLSAVDSDGGCGSPVGADDVITYSLVEAADNVFRISAENGSVYLNVGIDYEHRQSFIITAKAMDDGGLYSLCNVTISVENVNDVAPVFVNDSYTATVRENVALGTQLFTVAAVDGDSPPYNKIWFKLEGTGASYFAVGRSTGIVTVNKTVDFEETGRNVSFVVVACDGVHNTGVVVMVNVVDLNDEPPVFNVGSPSVILSGAPALVAADLTVSDPDTDYDDIVNATATLSVPRCVSDLVRNTSYGTPTITSQYGDCGAASGIDLTYEMLDFVGLWYPGYGYSFTGDFYGRVSADKIPTKLANNLIISICFGLYKGGSGTLVGRNTADKSLDYRVVINAWKVTFEYVSSQNTKVTLGIYLDNAIDDNRLHTLSLLVYYPRMTAYWDGDLVGTVAMPLPMQCVDSGPFYIGKMPSDKLAFKGYIKSAIIRRGFASFLPQYSTGVGNLTATSNGFRFDESRRQYAQVPDDLIPHGIGRAFSVYVKFNVSQNNDGFLFAKADKETGLVRPYAVFYESRSRDPRLEFSYKTVGSTVRRQKTVFLESPLDDGFWHVLILVVNGQIANFIVDGKTYVVNLDGTIDDADTSHTFFIGSRPQAASEEDYFDGEMSHFIVRSALTTVTEFHCFLSGFNASKYVSDCSRRSSPCLPESERCVYDTKKYTQCGMKDFVDLLKVADAPRSASGHVCLNGVDDVYVANLTAYGVQPALVNECTISLWIRLESGTAGYVLSQYDNKSVVQFAIYVKRSEVQVNLPTGQVTLNSDLALDGDIWHHITVIISRVDVVLVREGSRVDSKLLPISTETFNFNTDYPFHIGAALNSFGDYTGFLKGRLRGLIASVKAEQLYFLQCVSDCREYLRYDTNMFTTSADQTVSTETISNLDGKTSTSGVVTTTGSLTFSGVNSARYYTSTLRRLEYVNLYQGTTTERRSVSYVTSDGVQSSGMFVSVVSVSPANTAATTLDLDSKEDGVHHVAVFTENAQWVRIVSDNPSFTDLDREGDRVTMIEVQLEESYEETGMEAIQYTLTTSDPVIKVTAEESNATFIVLYGITSYYEYQTALKRLIYINMAPEPIRTSRRVSFVVHEYPYRNYAVYTTIEILPENDNIPEIYLEFPSANFNTSYIEDSDGVAIVGDNVTVTDEDVGQMVLQNLTVAIVNFNEGDLLVWTARAPSPLYFINVSDTELIVQGPGSLSAFENALKLLRYRSRMEEPASHTRRIRFKAYDGRHYSAAVYTFVAIVFRDDHDPILYLGGGTAVNNTVSFQEEGSAVNIAANDTRILDGDSVPTQITRVLISVTAATDNDALSNSSAIPDSLRIHRINVSTIELTGQGSFEDYVASLKVIAYRDTGDEPNRLFVIVEVKLWCLIDGVTSTCGTSFALISITPVDDNQPMFSRSVYYGNVSEDAIKGTSVVDVVVVDEDRFSPSDTELSLTDTFGGRFRISQSGRVEVGSTSLDLEMKSSYTLEITLFESSGSGPSNGASTMVEINVLDANDNPPVFVQASFSESLAENAASGQIVLQLSATDNDTIINSRMSFSIASSTPGLPFAVNNASGVITVSARLDYEDETRRRFDFQVEVRDPDVAVFRDTANVTILLTDVNDNAVEIRGLPEEVVLREPNRSVLVSPNATLFDKDTVPSSLDRLEVAITSSKISTESVIVVVPVNISIGDNYSNGGRFLRLSGRASTSHYESILRTLMFVDNATDLKDDNRTVSITAIDTSSSQPSNPAVDVRVRVVILNNDPPSIDLDSRDRSVGFSGLQPNDFDFPDDFVYEESNSYLTKYTEDGNPVRLSHSSLDITDPDASSLVHRAVVNITNIQDGNSERLSVVTESGITQSNESTTSWLVLNGPASHADFERVLYSVRYENRAVQPSGKFRAVSFVVNDGKHDSAPANAYVELVNVNDVPDLRIGDGAEVDNTVTYVEGSPPISIASQDLRISDVDDTTLESATVLLTVSHNEDEEVLNVSLVGSGLILDRHSNYFFELRGSAKIEDYATVLKTLTYTNTIRFERTFTALPWSTS